ncbi:hypothetical protein Avbf_07255, partial [Armadillidium vulgare]
NEEFQSDFKGLKVPFGNSRILGKIPYWKSPISYLNSSPFPHEKRYGSCTNFLTGRIGPC